MVNVRAREAVDDFSVAVSYDEIAEKNYSLSAGQYFEVKIEFVDITEEEFNLKIKSSLDKIKASNKISADLTNKIFVSLEKANYGN